MKITILIIALFIGMTVFGQGQYTDIVYPADSEDTISNCNIIKVKEGNVILFEHHGVVQKLAAKAIVWDSEYYDLSEYLEKETESNATTTGLPADPVKEKLMYNYYNGLYLKSKKQMGTGMFLTVFGLGTGIIGYKLLSNNTYNGKVTGSDNTAIIGSIMFLGGALLFNAGAPIWIVGAVKKGANKKEMEKIKPRHWSLQYGITENGIGLVLKL